MTAGVPSQSMVFKYAALGFVPSGYGVDEGVVNPAFAELGCDPVSFLVIVVAVGIDERTPAVSFPRPVRRIDEHRRVFAAGRQGADEKIDRPALPARAFMERAMRFRRAVLLRVLAGALTNARISSRVRIALAATDLSAQGVWARKAPEAKERRAPTGSGKRGQSWGQYSRDRRSLRQIVAGADQQGLAADHDALDESNLALHAAVRRIQAS